MSGTPSSVPTTPNARPPAGVRSSSLKRVTGVMQGMFSPLACASRAFNWYCWYGFVGRGRDFPTKRAEGGHEWVFLGIYVSRIL